MAKETFSVGRLRLSKTADAKYDTYLLRITAILDVAWADRPAAFESMAADRAARLMEHTLYREGVRKGFLQLDNWITAGAILDRAKEV